MIWECGPFCREFRHSSPFKQLAPLCLRHRYCRLYAHPCFFIPAQVRQLNAPQAVKFCQVVPVLAGLPLPQSFFNDRQRAGVLTHVQEYSRQWGQ